MSEQEEGQPTGEGGGGAGDGAADATNSNTNRVAQVAPLPLEWTTMGQTDPDAEPVIRYPSEVMEWSKEDDEIMSVGTAGQKITVIGSKFYEECSPDLKKLIMRSHCIHKMEGLEGFSSLELLEFYDNIIDELSCLGDGENGAPGITLKVLDMSYNAIRDMQPVEFCPNLTELYIANNKLKTMAGLKGLTKLRKLDLGANRFRVIEVDELSGLVNLEELWLGKNKIEKIQGLEKLTKLRRLDIQSNRLTEIENLTSQNDTLEELFLAHNGLTTEGISFPTGLALAFPNLNVLDLGRNQITDTTPIAHLKSLEELWISGNQIETFEQVEPLRALGTDGGQLDTVYLEYNPVAKEFEYRKRVAEIIPSLKQIDANLIAGLTANNILPASASAASGVVGITPAINRFTTSAASNQSALEQMQRLQEAAIARAKAQQQ